MIFALIDYTIRLFKLRTIVPELFWDHNNHPVMVEKGRLFLLIYSCCGE